LPGKRQGGCSFPLKSSGLSVSGDLRAAPLNDQEMHEDRKPSKKRVKSFPRVNGSDEVSHPAKYYPRGDSIFSGGKKMVNRKEVLQ